MKLITAFIFVFAFNAPSMSQTEDEILKIAQLSSVRIVSTAIKENSPPLKDFGKGIILKGKYLATCYHLIVPEDSSFKLSTIELIYNERYENGIFKYDSMILIKDFKPSKDQYDFSKHKYIREDRSTDFVVLKLSKEIKKIKYKFSEKPPKFLDKTYSLGNLRQGEIINPAFQAGLSVFNYSQKQNSPSIFFGCIVPYTVGFSGTPLYNTKGEILGIIQFSFEVFPTDLLNNLYMEHQITEQIYIGIKKAYQEGKKLQFAIDFNFLKRKYLKGYL